MLFGKAIILLFNSESNEVIDSIFKPKQKSISWISSIVVFSSMDIVIISFE